MRDRESPEAIEARLARNARLASAVAPADIEVVNDGALEEIARTLSRVLAAGR